MTTVVATDVVTVTSTTVSKVYSVVPKRDLQQRVPIASTSPSWAPHCNGDDKYSSACSCFGASPATLTQTPDAVTSYVSATATVTTVVAPPPAACAGNDNSPYVQCCGSFSDGYLGSNCQTRMSFPPYSWHSRSCCISSRKSCLCNYLTDLAFQPSLAPQTDAESAQNFCSALGESTYCCASQASSVIHSLLSSTSLIEHLYEI